MVFAGCNEQPSAWGILDATAVSSLGQPHKAFPGVTGRETEVFSLSSLFFQFDGCDLMCQKDYKCQH